MKLQQKSISNINTLINSIDLTKCGVSLIKVEVKGKERIFTVPNQYQKSIQKDLLNILEELHLPKYVYSQKGSSFIQKVKFHKDDDCLLNLDIKGFFPSIHYKRIEHLFNEIGVHPNGISVLTKAVTHNSCLPLGFSTSPILANLVFSNTDLRLYNWALKRGLKYSRYVDDITFSGKKLNIKSVQIPISIIKHNDFRVNPLKTSKVYQPNDVKLILGLEIFKGIISIPNEYYEEFANEVTTYKLLLNKGLEKEDIEELVSLRGKLNFIYQVDKNKYRNLLEQFPELE